MCKKTKNCWKCKNLNKSISMVLDDEVLYSCWCKEGAMGSEDCDKYIEENGLNTTNNKEMIYYDNKYKKYEG